MDTISASQEFLATIARMGWQARNAALAIAPILIILVAVFGVVKFYFGQESEGKINLNKYVYYNIFMLMFIVYYGNVVDITGSFTRILTDVFPRGNTVEMFQKVSDAKTGLYSMQKLGQIQSYSQNIDNIEQDTTKSWAGKQWSKLKVQAEDYFVQTPLNSDIFNFTDWFSSFLEVGFIRLIRALLEVSRNVMLSFLIIVGPFALMFEFVPFMRGIAQHWFKIFIAVSLWLLTLNILDAIYVNFATSRLQEAVGTFNEAIKNKEVFNDIYTAEGGEAGIINVVIAICYIFVPYLTTLYAGGQAAQQLFGAMMTMAQFAAVKAASGLMGGVGGGAGAGAGSVIGKLSDKT